MPVYAALHAWLAHIHRFYLLISLVMDTSLTSTPATTSKADDDHPLLSQPCMGEQLWGRGFQTGLHLVARVSSRNY